MKNTFLFRQILLRPVCSDISLRSWAVGPCMATELDRSIVEDSQVVQET
jgi:hypothetical protein